MPNVIFKPRPMVDPYAGKVGEMLGELFQTIGQIHQLRQQRNQTNAILDIMKDDTLKEEQKQAKILGVARQGGVLGNMIARSALAEYLIPEYEKDYKKSLAERNRAYKDYLKKGGSRGTDGLKTYKDYQGIYNSAAKQLNELRTIATKMKTQINPVMVEELEKQMEYGQRGMAGLSPSGEMPPGIAGGINAVDQNALGMPSVFNQPKTQTAKARPAVVPQSSGALGGMVGPPAPPDYNKYVPPGVQAKWASMTPEQRKAMMFAPTEGATIEEYATKAQQFIEPVDAEIEKEIAKTQPSPGGEIPAQAEPPSQEYFEQMVRHIARTDRSAAKAYYERWAPKWQ